MFLSLRELRFAKGRFAITIAAGFLIAVMVVLLSGLTSGLGAQSTAAVVGIGADEFAFEQPVPGQGRSFADSRVTEDQRTQLARQPGVDAAVAVGVAPTRIGHSGTEVAAVAFGVDGSSFAAPIPLSPGRIAVDRSLADTNGWRTGDGIEVGGTTVTIAGLVDDSFHNHQPVVWLDAGDWHALPTANVDSTAIAMRTGPGFDARSAAAATDTDITDTDGALAAIGGYQSERGSLLLMQGMLLVIGALVVGAFFTVWTIQRSQDLAVLKAIGASTGYLFRDGLGQALLVLVIGTGLGTATAAGLSVLASRYVPIHLTAAGALVPFVALVSLGLIGAATALSRIAAVDPLTALGSGR